MKVEKSTVVWELESHKLHHLVHNQTKNGTCYCNTISKHFCDATIDSKAVLGYIRNHSRKFKEFVTNIVEIIRENSCDSQWFHVNTKANHADYCSRGIDANNIKATETWFNDPSFL